MSMSAEILEPEIIQNEETDIKDTLNNNRIIVWNDNVNTFDHVIETLVELCEHTTQQAEQCALLIHFKGKCDVKKGHFEKLRPIAEGIIDRGINATIE